MSTFKEGQVIIYISNPNDPNPEIFSGAAQFDSTSHNEVAIVKQDLSSPGSTFCHVYPTEKVYDVESYVKKLLSESQKA